MTERPPLPDPKEFIEIVTRRALDLIRFGVQVSPEPTSLDILNESELSCIEVGITAGIVAAIEELTERELLT